MQDKAIVTNNRYEGVELCSEKTHSMRLLISDALFNPNSRNCSLADTRFLSRKIQLEVQGWALFISKTDKLHGVMLINLAQWSSLY
jgi:hypothetical protein